MIQGDNSGVKDKRSETSPRGSPDEAASREIEEKLGELRGKLRTSEAKSEARKRSAVSYQTKYGQLQREMQQAQNALAEELRASETKSEARKRSAVSYQTRYGQLQREMQQAQNALTEELRASEAKSEAGKRSALSYQTKYEQVQRDMQEAQNALTEERQQRAALEELLQEREEQWKGRAEVHDESLQHARKHLGDRDMEIQKLTASLKRSEMLRPSEKSPGASSTKKLVRLQRELQETQEKLRLEKRKHSTKQSQVQEKTKPAVQERTKPVLKDWIGSGSDKERGNALDSTGRCTTALPKSAVIRSEMADAIDRESAPISFVGINVEQANADETKESVRLEAELLFLASAYTNDEIKVQGGRVTRLLKLDAGGDTGYVTVILTLNIPDEYPESGTLEVTAALAVDNGYDKGSWKCAEQALPGLVDVCRWEAQGCEGSEALLSVLNTADDWVQTEWNAVYAKQFTSDVTNNSAANSGGAEICRMLVYTHHIVNLDKIHFVRQTASKHNLGGFIKVGRPGLIVVEGFEANCDSFLSTLLSQRKKMREKGQGKPDSSTFSEAGKALAMVSDMNTGRRLPKKLAQLENCSEGMNEFKTACDIVELRTHVEEASKR